MLLHKLLLVCTASLISLSFVPLKANADAISDYYHENSIRVIQAQRKRWNSYTPRQKQLARGVGQIAHVYYQKTRQPLPLTNRSIRLVMNALEATPQEATFIKDRMIAHSNAQGIIPRIDAAIHRTQNFLNCLNNHGTGCIP